MIAKFLRKVLGMPGDIELNLLNDTLKRIEEEILDVKEIARGQPHLLGKSHVYIQNKPLNWPKLIDRVNKLELEVINIQQEKK